MLRLLASRLLNKKLPAARKATRKREDELEWRAKKRRQSREIRPADGSDPALRNQQGFRHVPVLNLQTSRQLIFLQRARQRVRNAVNFFDASLFVLPLV